MNFKFRGAVEILFAQRSVEKGREKLLFGGDCVEQFRRKIERITLIRAGSENIDTVGFHGAHRHQSVGKQLIGGRFHDTFRRSADEV